MSCFVFKAARLDRTLAVCTFPSVFRENPVLEDKCQFASSGNGIIEMRLGYTRLFCKVRVLVEVRWNFCNECPWKLKLQERQLLPKP
jgi:hypothetical protein